MANSPMAMFTFLALVLAALLSAAGPAAAQSCGCQSNECCSQDGYCGTTGEYCGKGCQSGPCTAPSGGTSSVPVESVVTERFFNGIKSQAGNTCPGKSFYTRQSFLDGARPYPDFGKGRSNDDSKREIAAFFAHVTHETGHLCYIEEISGASKDYCNETNTQWPCYPGKGYYGRWAAAAVVELQLRARGEESWVRRVEEPGDGGAGPGGGVQGGALVLDGQRAPVRAAGVRRDDQGHQRRPGMQWQEDRRNERAGGLLQGLLPPVRRRPGERLPHLLGAGNSKPEVMVRIS